MPLLSSAEALHVSDSFLSSLYGEEIFMRWKELKYEMKFDTERDYVAWLIDVANHYRKEDSSTVIEDQALEYTDKDSVQNTYGELVYKECINQKSFVKLEQPNEISLSDPAIEMPEPQILPSNTLNDDLPSGSKRNRKRVRTEENREVSEYDSVIKAQDFGVSSHLYNNDNSGFGNSSGGGGYSATMGCEEDYDVITLSPNSGNELNSASGTQDLQFADANYSMGTEESHNYSSTDVVTAVVGKNKRYSCEYCNYQCTQSNHLKKHCIRKHGYASKYSCSKCGQYYLEPSALHRHAISCKG